ncbi:coiled-coil domain-containing protein [Oopsacas minuta]|uniref:Coiled-coil domain-containing protein n=1 Tax=Oopsacas minuta TaxID=111878 RepID=A0AAV7JPE2_9METZ|nr:coiled-coil domain-containing protein [Oopsacas minuta]
MNISEENIDIESSLQLLSSFELKCNEMVSENIQLQEQLTLATESKTESKKQLQDKMLHIQLLQDSVDTVQSALGQHLVQQEENSNLKSRIKELELKAEGVTLSFENERESWRINLKELECKQEAEIDEIKEEQLFTVVNLNKKFDHEITLRDKKISELEGQLNVAEKDKKEEITKLKLEYEARLMKAMRQNSISSHQNQTGNAGMNNSQDIYRRKLEHMQQLHSREVVCLKQKINELQERANPKQRTHLY